MSFVYLSLLFMFIVSYNTVVDFSLFLLVILVSQKPWLFELSWNKVLEFCVLPVSRKLWLFELSWNKILAFCVLSVSRKLWLFANGSNYHGIRYLSLCPSGLSEAFDGINLKTYVYMQGNRAMTRLMVLT